ncbi:lipopolysaccharide assembly protein LapA domain-containing protein [Nocardia sp. NPDC052112]|uniref:LapA family protein n=1 Tax=Nocardia sp. NPDC052112 TaxID=3155646 RepID=UPI00342D782D
MTSHAESPEPEHTEEVAPPSPADRKTVEPSGRKTVTKTRTGQTWVGLIVAALIGIVVLIFILQNLEQQRVDLFFWNFSLPVGILVLLSAIAGALVMALVGGVRIFQLRRAVKR